MRQAAVIDVGCHSALLMVARRQRTKERGGARGRWAMAPSGKIRLALHETLTADGRVSTRGIRSVQSAVEQLSGAEHRGHAVFAFATSVIRDAANRDEVIGQVADTTGVRLRLLPGREEARLAYIAARCWLGGGPGPLLVLDIGGGTVEVAHGEDAEPARAHSLPLGARAVTRALLPGGVLPADRTLADVRQQVREALDGVPLPVARPGTRVIASSKTFTQLAKLATTIERPTRAPAHLTLSSVRAAVELLARTDPRHRGDLKGISRHRAEQSLAGAVVAEALMEACQVREARICPWSTREGLLLERVGESRGRRTARTT
ncbi:Ppx/GppA phosphatase family protein [Nonomuraea maritima]|uniref:Ppx/GppA phosphatase family protein n=1 Tax=Nonomuraea maritima TaxID=683260 RepID=UPI0037136F25